MVKQLKWVEIPSGKKSKPVVSEWSVIPAAGKSPELKHPADAFIKAEAAKAEAKAKEETVKPVAPVKPVQAQQKPKGETLRAGAR